MEAIVHQLMQKGVDAHKQGNLKEAENVYLATLKTQSEHPEANYNLNVLASPANKVEEALPFLKNTLEANSKIEQFWLSYIDALIKVRRFDFVKAILKKAKMQGLKGKK